eukprot:CAMPEP_0198648674 /NCGR_PEP_ID=MMETSP1467-20131203/3678_1 /TAXON_ID=1462469 /ORGANISM="unid. sp., Strain CCMP2135" /LENGTH=352 /DNA_ID=CAMNT_0044384409 /DNA_START=30 /DNA_END=1088 /DNA_ORIENTATION=+
MNGGRPEARELPLSRPTRSYVKSTRKERVIGFLAASLFSVAYYLAPTWLLMTALACVLKWWTVATLLILPIVTSLALPESFIRDLGKLMLKTSCFLQIPKYFSFEEFHEFRDEDFGEATHSEGKSFIFACHPHGVFPFSATCALVSCAGAEGDDGHVTAYAYKDRLTEDMPTAVATVLRFVPLLKDIVGLFHIIDASAPVLTERLQTKGSVSLYVGGMLELFLASPTKEVVFLKKRKGFIKLALRTGADVVPVYLFGNTTCLSALTSGPLAFLSRKLGVSLTLFWGRWGLPLPRPTKLTYARGLPLGLPHLPQPTDADVDHWHAVYCDKLQALFDNYKRFNPDYADKILVIE